MIFRLVTFILIVGICFEAHAQERPALMAPSRLSTLEGITLGMSKDASLQRYKENNIPIKEPKENTALINMYFNRRPAIYVFSFVDNKLKMVTVNIPTVGKSEKEKNDIFNLDTDYLRSKFGKPTTINTIGLGAGWKYDVGYIAYKWFAKYDQFTLIFDGYK